MIFKAFKFALLNHVPFGNIMIDRKNYNPFFSNIADNFIDIQEIQKV